VWGELYGARNGVHCPTKDGFSGGPCSVALEKFFGGNRVFLKGAVSGRHWAENLVDAVKEGATGRVETGTCELSSGNEIVHIYVHEVEWWFQRTLALRDRGRGTVEHASGGVVAVG
jgi:hypothetical protein